VARNRLGPIAGKVDSEHADIDAALSMAPTDHEAEDVPPAQEPEEMPLPSDPKVIFLLMAAGCCLMMRAARTGM
jgi:hypothetical protein